MKRVLVLVLALTALALSGVGAHHLATRGSAESVNDVGALPFVADRVVTGSSRTDADLISTQGPIADSESAREALHDGSESLTLEERARRERIREACEPERLLLSLALEEFRASPSYHTAQTLLTHEACATVMARGDFERRDNPDWPKDPEELFFRTMRTTSAGSFQLLIPRAEFPELVRVRDEVSVRRPMGPPPLDEAFAAEIEARAVRTFASLE